MMNELALYYSMFTILFTIFLLHPRRGLDMIEIYSLLLFTQTVLDPRWKASNAMSKSNGRSRCHSTGRSVHLSAGSILWLPAKENIDASLLAGSNIDEAAFNHPFLVLALDSSKIMVVGFIVSRLMIRRSYLDLLTLKVDFLSWPRPYGEIPRQSWMSQQHSNSSKPSTNLPICSSSGPWHSDRPPGRANASFEVLYQDRESGHNKPRGSYSLRP